MCDRENEGVRNRKMCTSVPRLLYRHQRLVYPCTIIANSYTTTMASCRDETKAYRQCLKDARNSGGSSSKACTRLAKTLEACREKWRQKHNLEHSFDGTRVLPNPRCQSLNYKMQTCLKWKEADESQCRSEIDALQACMRHEKGVVAAPTEGDKIWSDYKKQKDNR